MILIACVDGRNGMAFNGRRQSRDRLVRWDLLKEAGRAALWMDESSALQFTDIQRERLRVDEDFLDKAGPGEFCFVEDRSVKSHGSAVERVILYRWDRAYPADLYWDLPLEGWTLEQRQELAGYSHKLITKEVYVP